MTNSTVTRVSTLPFIRSFSRSLQQFSERHAISLAGTTPNVRDRTNFSKSDLIAACNGSLFEADSPKLPSTPLLMIDRVVEIDADGGDHDRGFAVAELDLKPSTWFFKHHFLNDPIMPGCLQIESLWQLSGFHLAWLGFKGQGRVVNSGKTRFHREVTVDCERLTVSIHVKKLLRRPHVVCILDGTIRSDNILICKSESLQIGVFRPQH